jgi:predicted outer membrane protein
MRLISHPITLAIALVSAFLTGCAVDNQSTGTRGIGFTYQSAVKPLPEGNFFIEAEAAPLAGRQDGALAVATEQASNFCALRKQQMSIVKKELASHLIVNGVARLTFKCA